MLQGLVHIFGPYPIDRQELYDRFPVKTSILLPVTIQYLSKVSSLSILGRKREFPFPKKKRGR